jgi:C4-dicarboxylate-specific signal transduction histidine kinase/ActR/RegA family two-component response regulator
MFKLQYKIALLQFLVGCAIVLLGLIVHHQYSIKTIHKEAKNSLQLLSHKIAQQVDFVLQEKAAKIKALSSAPVVGNLLLQSNTQYSLLSKQQRNEQIAQLNRKWMGTKDKTSPFIQSFLSNSVAQYFLSQFALNPGEYGEIFLTNRYGALVASTKKLTTYAHGHKYWWIASYNGGLGKIFFDDRGFDASVEGYVLGIVVPVKKDGQIIGILKCNIRIQGLLDKIVNSSSTEHRQILIVRDGGAVVLQPGHKPLSTKANPEIQAKLDTLQAGSLSFDKGAVPSFAGFSPVLTSHETDKFSFGGNPKSIDQSQGNQGEGWNVVTTECIAHALRLSRQSNRYFYMIYILIVFMLAFIALYIGRRIATPLNAFSTAAKAIGKGEFNVKLAVTTKDELGAVALAFNNMAENLATTRAEYSLEIEQRKQTEIALKSSENQLNEAQRIAKIGSWELDLTTNSLSWSDEVYRILDLAPQKVPATYKAFLNNIHPEDRELVNCAYRDLAQNKIPSDIVHRLLLTNGELKYVRECCETSYDDNGQACCSLGTVQDVTKSVLAEIEHLKLEEQLRQKHKMEAVGYMAGGMAHNFNNNLSIILGNVELSILMVQKPKVSKLLQNAKIGILRSRDLIQQIITYSRKGAHQKTLTQLPSILDETITLLRSTLPSSIQLSQDISPESRSVVINADVSQIQEVLINLSNNAIQAMDEKGELKIILETVELNQKDIPAQYEGSPGRYAKLSVKDSGHGMPAEILNKIFDPFFSTKEEHEGAGMGLATVQGIVAQHGGIIKVNSVPRQGTVFNLYFPLVDETFAEVNPINANIPIGTEKILFIDDDKMLVNLGELLLTKMGYEVTSMSESTEALKLFLANPENFDLVITDQTMPELTGKQLIEEIKKVRPNIPTIICTGYSSKIDKDMAKQLGTSAFLMKPLAMPELSQTVRRVLDGAKNQQPL